MVMIMMTMMTVSVLSSFAGCVVAQSCSTQTAKVNGKCRISTPCGVLLQGYFSHNFAKKNDDTNATK